MTPDEIKAALAEAIEEAIDSVHDMDVTHADYAKASAAAVLQLVGPKQLEWEYFDGGRGAKAPAWGEASYLITRWSDGRFELVESYPGYQGDNLAGGFLPTLEAAQAAAQAHADAAHWGDMVLADMIGGK